MNHLNLAFQSTAMFALNQENSIANHYLAEIRDVSVQQDRARFRRNIKRLGTLLAYEVSKALQYEAKPVETPLATTHVNSITDDLVLIPIMRAALPFYEGFLELFDEANSGFIGAWRTHNENKIDAELNYQAAPSIDGKTIVIIDPMLATGKSLVKTVQSLSKTGSPKSWHLASAIAAPEGIAYVQESLGENVHLWTCAIDEKLNEQAYIVPGLGDAGDLAFGPKL